MLKHYNKTKNFQLSYITAGHEQGKEGPLEFIQKNVMDQFHFIALVERMEESLVVMKLLWGLKDADIIVLSSKSAGGYDDGKFRGCIKIAKSFTPPKVEQFFEQNHTQSNHDYLLYAAVNRSLDKTIDRLGRDLVQREVEKHRKLQQFAQDSCFDEAMFPCGADGILRRKQSDQSCYWNDAGCGHQCVDRVLDALDAKSNHGQLFDVEPPKLLNNKLSFPNISNDDEHAYSLDNPVHDINSGALAAACGVLITSQGGVGSTDFMTRLEPILQSNDSALNFLGDEDGFKHKPATYWKHHDGHALIGTFRNYKLPGRSARACFKKVMVVIGDPIHTIKSTYRRFKVSHINKLKRGSNLGTYKAGTTLEQIFEGIAESGRDQTGIYNYIMSWSDAQADRSNWPEVRLVTTKILYSNAKEITEWIGISGKDLDSFSDLTYKPSTQHEVNVEGVSNETMAKVLKVFQNVTDIVYRVENERER